MIWYDMIWYDMVWYGMIWNDMIWYGMIWCDMIWYSMACVHVYIYIHIITYPLPVDSPFLVESPMWKVWSHSANPGDVLEVDEVLVVLVLLKLELEELVLDEPQTVQAEEVPCNFFFVTFKIFEKWSLSRCSLLKCPWHVYMLAILGCQSLKASRKRTKAWTSSLE